MYPAVILVAITATANHFILDAVAGSILCGIAWWGNDVLLNLLVLEDWLLWVVRIQKPEGAAVDVEEEQVFEGLRSGRMMPIFRDEDDYGGNRMTW
jgi:hypothetical protein